MVELQGNHDSRVGEQVLPVLIQALDRAEHLASTDGPLTETEARLAALWTDDAERLAEARSRLNAWSYAGFQARSGVETFYDPVLPGDVEDSVATMIFNAWYGRFLGSVIDDERFPGGAFEPTGDSGRQRLIKRILLNGRGADNPAGLASWNPLTGESIYFDVDGTEVVETSDELMVTALTGALDFLAGPGGEAGYGGFDTDDMDAWRWGYRHWVRFDSILADFLGDDPAFAALTDGFSISPTRFAVAPGMNPNDPRRSLPGFPRHGDHLNVDAGNPGTSGVRFNYGSGPVFRMVVSLGPDGPQGVNVLPGGQSGLNDSPHFDDQARLWLGNDTLPMRYSVDEVMAGAERRELFVAGE
jgi:penicillin amidase